MYVKEEEKRAPTLRVAYPQPTQAQSDAKEGGESRNFPGHGSVSGKLLRNEEEFKYAREEGSRGYFCKLAKASLEFFSLRDI